MKIILNLPDGVNDGAAYWAIGCARAFAREKPHPHAKPGPWGGSVYQFPGNVQPPWLVAQVHRTATGTVVVSVNPVKRESQNES